LEAVTLRSYRVTLEDGWRLEPESLDRAAAGARARAVVVVAPGNPTGWVPTAAGWEVIETVCAARGLALLVDGGFADYAEAGPTTAAVRRPPGLAFSLGGLSKTCGLPQLKLGWIGVHGPASATQAALWALDTIADTYLSVATPTQAALPRLFEL